ncbi:MAG: hypothetical protein ABJC05_11150 [Pyrinomonadaceae bacterium]
MKKLVSVVGLILVILSSPAHAKSPCKKQTIEELVKALADAYSEKDLGRLDANTSFHSVKIVIEHSLGEGADQYETRRFRFFKSGERWLRSREIEGAPVRDAKPLLQCKRGICTYDFKGGIVHRVLYLDKITYGYRNGCPLIKTIFLLDGD